MNCRGCGGTRLDTVFAMDPIPVAGDFKATRQEALDAPRHELEWRWCWDCGLTNVWPALEPDWRHYSYRASEVPALVRHHEAFARWLAKRWTPRRHVEIGGNDGVLAQAAPWPVFNIDPSDAWVGPGLNRPFTLELARSLPKADLITSSNSFAHFTGISDALAGVRAMIHRDGVFVVEVHDLAATISTKQWDTIYHEHAVEWSVDSLESVGGLHGLRLVGFERLALHGGLIRAVFRPGMPHTPHHVVREVFAGLQTAYDMAPTPDRPDGSVAYGAAARATIYLDHVRPNVERVIDGSPRRQGRYVPGVGLPIVPPSEFGDPPAALITAVGHEDDIKARHPEYERWASPC